MGVGRGTNKIHMKSIPGWIPLRENPGKIIRPIKSIEGFGVEIVLDKNLCKPLNLETFSTACQTVLICGEIHVCEGVCWVEVAPGPA